MKLAGLGAKNLAAILVALAKEEEKTHGPTHLTRLLRSGEELKLLPHQKRGPAAVPPACKGIRHPVLPDQKQISGQRAERYPVSGQRGGKRQPRAGAYGLSCAAGKGGGGKKGSRPAVGPGSASQTRGHGSDSNARTTATERPSVRAPSHRLQKQARTPDGANAVRTVTRDEPVF